MSFAQRKTEAAEIKPIARRRLSDVVYQRIREAILERRFKPGERLSIPDLAAQFDVSQMPVRQAVERLQDDGLVEVRPRSGTYVAEAEERDIAETFDIRRALESLAAQTAVVNVTDRDVEELEELLEGMERLGRAGYSNSAGHDRLNTEFHRNIVALSGNQKLSEMYDELNAHLKIARVHLSSTDWATRVDREQTEHREILNALESRDAQKLADALGRHIDRSRLALIGDIRRTSQDGQDSHE